jgi:hypothetical protein
MATDMQRPSSVGPALPILTTIGWILAALILALPTAFSPMLFDSGGSTWTVLIVVGLVLSLLLCGVSIVGGWVTWALTRGRRGGGARILRGVLYLLPLLGIAITLIGFAGIQVLCSGNLDCSSL